MISRPAPRRLARPHGGGLGRRLFAAQALIVFAGALTLLLVAFSVAPVRRMRAMEVPGRLIDGWKPAVEGFRR